jgi:hypothetical protein
VDVDVLSRNGRSVAVAVIAGDPDIGTGLSLIAALRQALSRLGADATIPS